MESCLSPVRLNVGAKREDNGVKEGSDHGFSLENHPGREVPEIWTIVSGEKKQLSTELLD